MLLEQEAGDEVREQEADHGQGQQHWCLVRLAVEATAVATVVATAVAKGVIVVVPRQVAVAVEVVVPVVEQGQGG